MELHEQLRPIHNDEVDDFLLHLVTLELHHPYYDEVFSGVICRDNIPNTKDSEVQSRSKSWKYFHKMFRSRSAVIRHECLHTRERPHNCEKCQKTLNKKANLTCHVQTAHKGIKKYEVEG